MTMPPGTPPRTTEQPARAAESAPTANWVSARLEHSASREEDRLILNEWERLIRAAERALLEARIAEMEHENDHLRDQEGWTREALGLADARAQRAREDALEEAAQAVERIGPRVSGDAIRALAAHRTATGGQAE